MSILSGGSKLQKEQNMKWYTFVIYFQLWLTLISGVFNGLSLITGSTYQGLADVYYSSYPGLQYMDWSYGMILVGWGVFAVYVRSRLKGFMADGPRLYLILLAINPASSLVYNAIAGAITGGLDVFQLGISILVNCLVIWLNVIYFRKRQHLFCNEKRSYQ